jgi:transposase
VRLALTSGRTRRLFTDDLGVDLSKLTRWIAGSRDSKVPPQDAAAQADLAAELKRLRRENEMLRQERDILKLATARFASEGSRLGSPLSIRRRKNSPYTGFVPSWVSAGAVISRGSVGQPVTASTGIWRWRRFVRPWRSAGRIHSPFGPRRSGLFHRVSGGAQEAWRSDLDVWQGELL